MPARRIVDASPLILLGKAGRLEFLRVGADQVIVPAAVLEEVRAKGQADPALRAVASADWLDIAPTREIPDPVAAYRLGRGETSVLALAFGASDCEVVLDDLAARRAASLGVRCLGSLGLVFLARRQGLIPAARPAIEELQRAGLYLDDDFVAEVLNRVGE